MTFPISYHWQNYPLQSSPRLLSVRPRCGSFCNNNDGLILQDYQSILHGVVLRGNYNCRGKQNYLSEVEANVVGPWGERHLAIILQIKSVLSGGVWVQHQWGVVEAKNHPDRVADRPAAPLCGWRCHKTTKHGQQAPVNGFYVYSVYEFIWTGNALGREIKYRVRQRDGRIVELI